MIDAVGPGGPGDRIGQRVWVYLAATGHRWGTAAEWTVVPENRAVPLPDGVSEELGASLGVPGLTAHHLVFADGPVKDATVLVAGGAGAVGHFSIEFAAWGGAGRVASTVSGPAKAELARQAGAGHVVYYTDPDAASQITGAVGPVDRIVEVALGANLQLDLAISRPGTPRLAPSSMETPSGSGTARFSGTTVHSAAVPQRRPAAARYSHTRWPIRSSGPPGPTASITPAPS